MARRLLKSFRAQYPLGAAKLPISLENSSPLSKHASGSVDRTGATAMQHFVELLGLTVLALIAAATLMHGDVFFGVFFGVATGAAWTHLIRHCLDLSSGIVRGALTQTQLHQLRQIPVASSDSAA